MQVATVHKRDPKLWETAVGASNFLLGETFKNTLIEALELYHTPGEGDEEESGNFENLVPFFVEACIGREQDIGGLAETLYNAGTKITL